MEQVGAGRGGQPGAVEVLQPPQVQALPGQRVHVADGAVLGHPALGCRTERHLMQVGADHRHGHPAPAGDTGMGGEHLTQRLRQLVAVGGGVRPGQVDVDDQAVRGRAGDPVDSVQGGRQSRPVGDRRYQLQLLAGQFVGAGDELAARLVKGGDVLQGRGSRSTAG